MGNNTADSQNHVMMEKAVATDTCSAADRLRILYIVSVDHRGSCTTAWGSSAPFHRARGVSYSSCQIKGLLLFTGQPKVPCIIPANQMIWYVVPPARERLTT